MASEAMRPLYELGDELLSLNALLEECEGDLSRAEEINPAVNEWFGALATEQAEKLERYVGWLKVLDMEAAAARAEAEQWAAKAKSRTSRSDYLRKRLLDYLTATGQTKCQTATGRTVSVCKVGGKLPVVLADPLDPATVPDALCRVRREVDKVAVAEALERGEVLAFASFGERGTRLSIR